MDASSMHLVIMVSTGLTCWYEKRDLFAFIEFKDDNSEPVKDLKNIKPIPRKI